MNTLKLTSRARAAALGRAYTTVELLVVILVILVVAAAVIPAFSSLIGSSRRSLAEAELRGVVQAARDASVATGEDAVAVFYYDPETGYRMVVAQYAGTVDDLSFADSGDLAGSPTTDRIRRRDVFAPSPSAEDYTLPLGWEVRGLAPSQSMLNTDAFGGLWAEWYDSAFWGSDNTGDAAKQQANWVFPETGFYDETVAFADASVFTPRQTFVVRFEGGTGRVLAGGNEVIVVDPRRGDGVTRIHNSERAFALDGTSPDPGGWKRADLAPDLRVWAERMIRADDLNSSAAQFGGDGFPNQPADITERAFLVGSMSLETVLARPVTTLALYDVDRLAAGVGVDVDRDTGTLYRPYPASNSIEVVPGVDRVLLNNWLWGVARSELPAGEQPLTDGRALLFQPRSYSGRLEEVVR